MRPRSIGRTSRRIANPEPSIGTCGEPERRSSNFSTCWLSIVPAESRLRTAVACESGIGARSPATCLGLRSVGGWFLKHPSLLLVSTVSHTRTLSRSDSSPLSDDQSFSTSMPSSLPLSIGWMYAAEALLGIALTAK